MRSSPVVLSHTGSDAAMLHPENRSHALSECIMAIAINTTQGLVDYFMGSGLSHRAVLCGLDSTIGCCPLHSVFYKH